MKDAIMINKLFHSPFYKLNNLSEQLSIDLWVKRDDLIPHYLGGNKVRKNLSILQSCKSEVDAIITNGGAESNHARVVALLGAQLGIKVHLVLHGNAPSSGTLSGNSFFYRSAGAVTHYVDSHDIAHTIDSVESDLKSQGLATLTIPGGAHSSAGASAYAEAIDELSFEPDFIVHASGTGGTQAGLLQGVMNQNWSTQVIGVSVARGRERGIEEIAKLLPDSFPQEKIIFLDDYRFGGYEKFNNELLQLIKDTIQIEGLPLDLTYTGKAMFALHQLVYCGAIKEGSKVVFWHTGGLLNLTSTQL